MHRLSRLTIQRVILFLLTPFALHIVPEAASVHAQATRPSQTARPAPVQVRIEGPVVRGPIVRETLANGLRVVMSPERSVPTIAVAVYYDVGSRNEERGSTGFAHLFEHMMFQGSANIPKGAHFQYISSRGGDMNGTTSDDRTNYFETLPSNELELGLWLEADRMRSLAVTAENFENQRQTVLEERRQSYENQPYALGMLRANELAFGDYFPYSHSTIGEPADLRNAPLAAVQEFWNQWYAPNNAVLSIAGDFDPAEALAMIRRHFEGIPRRATPRFEMPPISAQTAERTETMIDRLAELPAFYVMFHIPPNRTPDHYALEMLTVIMGDGESSRLYQKLVKERQLLQEISVSTDDRRGPDLFNFYGVVASGKSAQDARALVFEEIDRVRREPVTQAELIKARNRIAAAFVFGLQTNLSRATHLAESEMYWGDANLINEELAKYLAVTDADITRVANEYFVPTNRTVFDIVPPSEAAEQTGAGQ